MDGDERLGRPRDPCPGVRDEAGYCPLAMLGNKACYGEAWCNEKDGERELEAKWAAANAGLRERMKTWFTPSSSSED